MINMNHAFDAGYRGNIFKLIYNFALQAQCLIHIGGDAVKVAYVPLQLLSIPPSFTMVAAKA